MKIKKSSWHYRLDTLLGSLFAYGPEYFDGKRLYREPKNLCRYFWGVVGKVAAAPFVAALALVVGVIVGISYVFYLGWMKFVRDPYKRRRIRKRMEKGPIHPFEPKIKPKHEPSLLVQYFRARKEKVCPLIELVDE